MHGAVARRQARGKEARKVRRVSEGEARRSSLLEEAVWFKLLSQTERHEKDEIELAKPHKFWDTQPVVHHNEEPKPGAIETKKVEDVRKEPYPLPEGYEWCELDLNNPDHLSEVDQS